MTSDALRRLRERGWLFDAPAMCHVVDNLIRDCGVRLPDDYVAFLRACNGGQGFLDIGPRYLRLWPAEKVIAYNLDYQMPLQIPGHFGFGDAGGYEFFAFDLRSVKSAPVVSIPFAPMDEDYKRQIAFDFTSLLNHVVSTNSPQADGTG